MQIRMYFRNHALETETLEPRDIKAEFFEIAKALKETSITLGMLTVGAQPVAAKKTN